MIQPLRRRHRLIVTLLAPVTVAAFLISLPFGSSSTYQEEFAGFAVSPQAPERAPDASGAFDPVPDWTFEIWNDAEGGHILRVGAAGSFRYPELLVYAMPPGSTAGTVAEGTLLGTWAPPSAGQWLVPEGMVEAGSRLVLYNLARQEEAASALLAF